MIRGEGAGSARGGRPGVPASRGGCSGPPRPPATAPARWQAGHFQCSLPPPAACPGRSFQSSGCWQRWRGGGGRRERVGLHAWCWGPNRGVPPAAPHPSRAGHCEFCPARNWGTPPRPTQNAGPTPAGRGARAAARPSPPRRGCRRSPQPPGFVTPPLPQHPLPPHTRSLATGKLLSSNETAPLGGGAGAFLPPANLGASPGGVADGQGVALRVSPRRGTRLCLPQRPPPPLLLLSWAAAGCGEAGWGHRSAQPRARRLLIAPEVGGKGETRKREFKEMYYYFFLSFFGSED